MNPITEILSKGLDVASKFIKDPKDLMNYELEMTKISHQAQMQIVEAQSSIIKTEAASTGFLASNWRPLLMLIFGGLIVARWLGWAAPNLSEAEALKLWDIVQLGLGGYVGGRTVEKIVPYITEAIKSKK